MASKDAIVKMGMDHGKGFSWWAQTQLFGFSTVQVRCLD
jgi:hypothetical protein